jgi:hypothetical protein
VADLAIALTRELLTLSDISCRSAKLDDACWVNFRPASAKGRYKLPLILHNSPSVVARAHNGEDSAGMEVGMAMTFSFVP